MPSFRATQRSGARRYNASLATSLSIGSVGIDHLFELGDGVVRRRFADGCDEPVDQTSEIDVHAHLRWVVATVQPGKAGNAVQIQPNLVKRGHRDH